MNDIKNLPYELDDGLGQDARIGLIVLQTDQTLEQEFVTLLRDGDVAVYHARIQNDTEIAPDTLRRMEQELPRAAELLSPSFDYDAVGYCCTSGSTMIGEHRVDEIIRETHPKARTSNPLTAAKAALKAMGLRKIALITPYAPEVTTEMQAQFNAAGVTVKAVASFNQSDDFSVARIAPQSVLEAILSVGADPECDGVFVSCTNLRVLSSIVEAEAVLGKPVLSSNQVLAWHLLQLAGVKSRQPAGGRLFQHDLNEGQ